MSEEWTATGLSKKAVLTVAMLICAGLLYLIARPFIPAIVWSSALAVMFSPVEGLLRRKTRSRTMAATLTLLLALIIVVIPAIYVSVALVREVAAGAGNVGAAITPAGLDQLKHNYPQVAAAFENASDWLDLPRLAQAATMQIGQLGGQLVQLSLGGLITLVLTFYFLFYLLRDREAVLKAAARVTPLSANEFRDLTARTAEIVFASAYATAAVAALQGFLGGVMFWFLGLPSPVFWGVIMGLLAVVPFLGAFIIWVPAAIMLALAGQWLPALVLATWGTIVVGLIDNLIYPILVGKRLALHPMVSFIAIVGGLLLFGAHGIILGPVIIALSQSLLPVWRSRLDGQSAGKEAAG
jgi:predicted PurR-regulated permease PerM